MFIFSCKYWFSFLLISTTSLYCSLSNNSLNILSVSTSVVLRNEVSLNIHNSSDISSNFCLSELSLASNCFNSSLFALAWTKSTSSLCILSNVALSCFTKLSILCCLIFVVLFTTNFVSIQLASFIFLISYQANMILSYSAGVIVHSANNFS